MRRAITLGNAATLVRELNDLHRADRGRRREQVYLLRKQQACEHLQRTAMRDDGAMALLLRDQLVECADARDEVRAAFPARRGECEGIAGPAVQFRAGNVVPGQALPRAERHFLQARIGARPYLPMTRNGIRELQATPCRAGP